MLVAALDVVANDAVIGTNVSVVAALDVVANDEEMTPVILLPSPANPMEAVYVEAET